jgi:hypothetical protein
MACDYTMAMKHDNFVHPVPRTQIMIGWTAPEVGWVRISTDGAQKENGYAGCGGLIRGSDKEWLGGFLKLLGQCQYVIQELFTIILLMA